MNNVSQLHGVDLGQIEKKVKQLSSGGDPPYDGGMEARLSAVEQSIARLDGAMPSLATKDSVSQLRVEMSQGFTEQIRWIVGIGVAVAGIAITVINTMTGAKIDAAVATLSATQSAQHAQATPAPIIINVPPAAPAVPASR